jgi:glutathione S-transferase
VTLKLVTIGVSHYCEKARWALDRSGLSYVEEAHPPIVHYLATLRHRTRRHLPALVTPHGTLHDSTDILQWIDSIIDRDARLYPEEHRTEIEALEDQFDEQLGPATRRFIYSWGLNHRDMMLELMSFHAPKHEIAMLRASAPLVVGFMKRGLRLSDAAMDKSLARIAKIFEDVGRRIDGKRYLVGDTFTAADLTFAALASPMVAPASHPIARSLDVPKELVATVEAMRKLPAGKFITRIYDEHRTMMQ